MRESIRTSAVKMLAAMALLGASGVAQASSIYYAGTDFALTLSSITSFGTLGGNVIVTSTGLVDHDTLFSTGVASGANTPVIDGPSGPWVLGDTFSQSTSTGGTAGDVVGFLSSDVGTTGTVTLKNGSDANTTYNFDWTLTLVSSVVQNGITPFADYADAQAEFSLATNAICVPALSAMVVSASTLNPALPGTSTSSGSLACTVLGGRTETLSIFERASGQATALATVPVPPALWLALSGLGMVGIVARRRAG